VVEPALVGVGVCAASVLVAVLLGLLLSRGGERLFRRGGRDGPSDDPEAGGDGLDAPEAAGDGAGEVPAEAQDA